MAIFSFRPPAAGRRKAGPTPPPDWDITRPAEFDDPALDLPDAFDPSGFAPSGFAESGFGAAPSEPTRPSATDPARPPSRAEPASAPNATSAPVQPAAETSARDALPADMAPNPGFAKNLTARPQNDEPLGAGWYISSWDLLQGCDVIEGAPVDLLPTEWQRKSPRR